MKNKKIGNSIFRFEQEAGIDSKLGNWRDITLDEQIFQTNDKESRKKDFTKLTIINQSKNYTNKIPFSYNKIEYKFETDDEKKYTYKVNFVKSGTEVFSKYKTAKPTDKQLLIFYEEESKETSNFFGTACRVKMGEERKNLMKSLINKKRRISVNGDSFEATNLEQWAKRITQHNKKIDYQVLLSAVKLELLGKSDDDSFFKSLLGLNNKLADWLYSGVDAMEKWKFTDVNYEYGKYYLNAEKKTFQPIIPISFFEISNQYEYLTTGKKDKKRIVNNGLKQLTELANSFDTVLLNASFNIVLATPTITDDILFATIFWLKNYLEKNLPEAIKTIFKKVKAVVKQVEKFIHQLGKQIENNLALFNAFLCGLTNGIISLFQTIVGLLAFVIDNIPILELENLTKEKIFAQQEKLEFIEDLVDTVSNNISELFEGLIKTIKNFPAELAKFAKAIGNKIKGLSQYFWVFIIGAVAFELILDAIIAFFTGGTSLAASIGSKISRATTKAAQVGIKTAKQVGKKIATTTTDLIKFLKRELKELIEAIKNGKFLEYLKEKILQLFDDVNISKATAKNADELIEKYGSLIKKGKPTFRRKFDFELKKIERQADLPSRKSKFKKDFKKKKRKISLETYLKKRKTLHINIEKGKKAEELFLKLFKGLKPDTSIKTAFTNRFTDNVLKGVGKEIKSGFIKNTISFQKQVLKDIDILISERSININKIEWHLLGGIDDKAVDFIIKHAKEKKVLDLFKIIIY